MRVLDKEIPGATYNFSIFIFIFTLNHFLHVAKTQHWVRSILVRLLMVVTIPVYSELYISRLQHTSTVGHPSTVGIPMNHNFSLPLFSSCPAVLRQCTLLLLLLLSLSRIIVVLLTRHTLDTADLLPSYLSHTFFDQALSVVVFFSFQPKLYVHEMLFIILVRLRRHCIAILLTRRTMDAADPASRPGQTLSLQMPLF